MSDQDFTSSTPEQVQTTVPPETSSVSQADIDATAKATVDSGVTTPSQISQPLTPGAELLSLGLQALESRVKAIEDSLTAKAEDFIDGHDALTTVPAGEMVADSHPLATDTKSPIDLLGDVVALIRRHFGADAV